MANLYYSNNFYNDVVLDRETPWRAEFQEYLQIQQTMLQEMWQTREMMERMYMGPVRNHRYNDTHVDYGIRVRHTHYQRLAPINWPPVYEDLSDDYVSCIQLVSNHIYESPNKKPIYEENDSYGEKVELPSEKQYVQPQPLVLAIVPVEEYPPQAQLITITIEINNNSDSFEEDNKVEGSIKKKVFGEIFMEGDEKEKSCLSAIWRDFSKHLSLEEPHAIYVDFSKYLFPKEPRVTYRKENSRTSFSSGGVWCRQEFNNIFGANENRKDAENNIEADPFDSKYTCFRQWKYKRKYLIIKPRVYFILFPY
jgi:hypothetical protein